MIQPTSRPLCTLVAAALFFAPFVQAQTVDFNVTSVADREVARRQAADSNAATMMAVGDQYMADKDYEAAIAQYKSAYDQVPDSVATQGSRSAALAKFSKATVALADQRIAEGRYEDAKLLCEMVIAPGYNPGYRPAVLLLARLEDPAYYNQTMGPRFIASVEEVKKMLAEAQGFYDSGRYDMAMKRTDQVLNIDKYNGAARRLQEQINNAKSTYAVDAYNEARSRSIWEVDRAWESPVKNYGLDKSRVIEQGPSKEAGTAYINNKLARITVPRLEFKDATIREAIDFLKEKSRELDATEPDPTRRGVNIVLKIDSASSASAAPAAIPGLEADPLAAPAGAAPSAESRITLSLTNIPLGEALKYVANLANLKVKVEQYAVAIVPQSEPTDVLLTKTWRVPPGFIQAVPGGAGAATGGGLGTGGTLGGGDATGAGSNLASKAGAKEFLESQGVQFPPGSSAYFLASSSQLIVRNTQEQIELIDIIVDSSNVDVPTQVEIEAKFVEITQNNLKELGFDWLVSAFNIGGERVFGAGGTTGSGTALNNDNYTFIDPATDTAVGTNPVTSGNRSGTNGISNNAIDSLLFGSAANTVAPGIFSLAGVFTDPQFQVVVRALDQKKGVDLLSSPKVTTKSGERATIEIIREFRYPIEFDPPQIPQDFGGSSSSGVGGSTVISTFPVTPTTPTAFETRNTGVTLEVEPVVGSDGYTIDLRLVPQVVEFEGFINYGSPIYTINTSTAGQLINGGRTELTPNEIKQPIFSTRKVTTSVSIWDGQTVSLGGLMREDVQKVDDKTPILGDIPILGRLFRSSIDQHLKRNLIIFVTARLINPAGEPISRDDEEEELVESTVDPNNFNVAPPQLPYFPK